MKQAKDTSLARYAHTIDDPWRWRPAAGPDTEAITAMAQTHFGLETDQIFENDPVEYSRNVLLATVNQFYNPLKELISVTTHTETGQILAYTWAMRGQYAPWSAEEMVAVRIAHVNMRLAQRPRIHLLAQMIRMWEVWSKACDIKIICSTTMRGDQAAFMHLHEDAGYSVRGSIAYKRLRTATFEVEMPADTATVLQQSNFRHHPYQEPPEVVIVATGAAPTMEIYKGTNNERNKK
jgi:hypothetical protein